MDWQKNTNCFTLVGNFSRRFPVWQLWTSLNSPKGHCMCGIFRKLEHLLSWGNKVTGSFHSILIGVEKGHQHTYSLTDSNYRSRTKYEGRYCFHRCLSVYISGGGRRGFPIPDPGGGVPHPMSRWGGGGTCPRSRQGVPPIQDWMGYPPPLTWNGVPPTIQDWMGYPLTHLDLGWGNPHHPGLDGVPLNPPGPGMG